MKTRVFIPSTRYIPGTGLERSVARWEWSRRGLMVVYRDGIHCRGAWRTLREFLCAVRHGHEGPVVETTERT